jgi:hypothetical protein
MLWGDQRRRDFWGSGEIGIFASLFGGSVDSLAAKVLNERLRMLVCFGISGKNNGPRKPTAF